MERLKPFDTVTEPDSRQEMWLLRNHKSGESRPKTFRDLYEEASRIELHDGVPEVIRNQFATAHNLILYSWFFYPFNVTAGFLALVTLELALRERFKEDARVKLGTPLKKLLRLAVADGLVREEGFTHLQDQSKETPESEPRVEPSKSYLDVLIEGLLYFRNELAHGTFMLYPHGTLEVGLCADFINQLFPEPASQGAH